MSSVSQLSGDRTYLVGLASGFSVFGTYVAAQLAAIALSATPLAPPAAPTLSQTPGGTIAATQYFAKIAFVLANGGITLPSLESNFSVSLNNLLVVTAPTAPAAYYNAVGWIPYVSTTTGTETSQSATIAFGTNWTEPTSGLIVGSAPLAVSTAIPSNIVSTGEVQDVQTAGRVDMPAGVPGPDLWVCNAQGYSGSAALQSTTGLAAAQALAATMSAANGNASVYVCRLFQNCVGP